MPCTGGFTGSDSWGSWLPLPALQGGWRWVPQTGKSPSFLVGPSPLSRSWGALRSSACELSSFGSD